MKILINKSNLNIMEKKIYIFIIFLSFVLGCQKVPNKAKVNSKYPDFYPKIENINWAERGFIQEDSLYQNWYRLVTFTEEEGFCIIVEKIQQGLAEGEGGFKVIEQKNITHIKGIHDQNDISVHYNIKKWLSPKKVLLIKKDTEKLCKILDLEVLSVKDTLID